MTLQNWLNNGWLTEHRASSQEIATLFAVADRDLSDCRTSSLSSDWRLNIAYNAALQTATAALAAAGYRAVRGAHHYRVIHSLTHTIKADVGLVSLLDQFRKKRNISEYDHVGMISDQEAKEMVDLAIQLRKDVEKWIRENHPDLLADK